eukprot:8846845-Pyramimonas_sp.AAC.1
MVRKGHVARRGRGGHEPRPARGAGQGGPRGLSGRGRGARQAAAVPTRAHHASAEALCGGDRRPPGRGCRAA